jgi:uncharacterized membrane protein
MYGKGGCVGIWREKLASGEWTQEEFEAKYAAFRERASAAKRKHCTVIWKEKLASGEWTQEEYDARYKSYKDGFKLRKRNANNTFIK